MRAWEYTQVRFSSLCVVHVLENTSSMCLPTTDQAAPTPPPPSPPPPPTPPLCQSGCFMISIPGDRYFTGIYNETQAHNASSIAACQAACLADRACVQITWAPTHGDKCVMYQSITGSVNGGAQGWVKCSSNASSVRACTGFVPTPSPPPRAPAHYLRVQFPLPRAFPTHPREVF